MAGREDSGIDRLAGQGPWFHAVRVPCLQHLILPGLLYCSPCLAGERDLSASELRREREEIAARLQALPDWNRSSQVHGRIGFYGQPKTAQWIVIDLGEPVVADEVILFPARLPVDTGGDGSEGFPPEIEVEIAADESFADAARLGRWEEPVPGGSVSPPCLRFQVAPQRKISGRFLRVRIFGSRLRASGRGRFFTLGEIVVLAQGRNAALGRPVETSGGIENPPRWQAANLTDGRLWCLPGVGRQPAEWNGFHSGIEKAADLPKWVEILLPEEVAADEVHLVPAYPRDFADTAGFGFPPRFRVVGADAAGREVPFFDSGNEPFPNPGEATVMIPAQRRALKRLRVECGELWQRTGDYLFALAEVQVWSKGVNVAAGCPVSAADAVETGIWRTKSLTDGDSSRWALLSWKDWLAALEERKSLQERLADIDRMLEAKDSEMRQRLALAGGLLALAVFGGLVVLLISQRRRAAASREALRERIAHDLHDELGAGLSHLALESDLARRQLPDGDPLRDRLARISASARGTLDHMRDVIWLLAPATDSWSGFQGRIEAIAERMLEGLDHAFAVDGEPPPGRPPITWVREWVLFFKEALTNARRHADASRIEIGLVWEPKALRLSVRDDGRGFDPENPAQAAGLGLKSYRRRAEALAGCFAIEPNAERGVTIRLAAPLPKNES